MAATTYLRLLKAAAFANGAAYQGPATYYGEFTTTEGDVDTPGTPSGAGRIVIAVADLDLDTTGKHTNTAQFLVEEAPDDLGEMAAFELWDAATDGNRHTVDAITPFTVNVGQRIRVQAGALTIEEL